MIEAKLVPKLRFPEFSGEWEVKKLGDVISHKGGTALESFVSSTGKYKFISIGNYTTDGKYIDDLRRIDDTDARIHERILHKDNLVMVLNDKTASGDIIGSTILIDADNCYVYNQRSERIIAKPDIVQPSFLWHKLNSQTFRKQVFSISQGGTQIYVNFPSVKKLFIATPSLEEQQKIAGFLTVVDERMGAMSKKMELLEQYKKGVMQKIFSQKLRFKDENGRNYPDWQERKLGDVVDIKTGKKDVNQGNPDGKYPFFTCAREHTFSDEYSFEGEAIMIAGNGEVGLCTYYDGKFEAYQRTYVLQDFSLPAGYLFIYLKNAFQEFAESQKQQGSMPYIKLTTLQKFSIPIQSEGEQQKIADFLTSLDDKINLEKTKLEQAKLFKKSLLQRMFV